MGRKTLILGRLLFQLRSVFLAIIVTSIVAVAFHEDVWGFIRLFVVLSVFVVYWDIIRPRLKIFKTKKGAGT